MKKLQVLAMFAVAALMTACGGKSATSVVDDAISAAEQEVPITDSPILGKLPSLHQQMKAAELKVDEFYQSEMNKAEKREDMSRLGDERKAAKGVIYKKYYELFDAEAKALNGREVKITFDDDQLSAGTAKLRYVEGEFEADIEKNHFKQGQPLAIDAELTLTAALSMKYGAPMWSFNYLDAQGTAVEELAGSFQRDDPRCSAPAGEKITFTIDHTPWIKKNGADADHVWVGFLR